MKKDNRRQQLRTNPYSLDQRRAAELRREREIGNWGRASEHIGRRWEDLGFESLRSMVTGQRPWPVDHYRPRVLVPFMSDAAVQAALACIGLPSPDVVVVLADGNDRLALQALDFKWDLEFASYDQIRASALQALFDHDSGVLSAAVDNAAGLPLSRGPYLDGLLFAPDTPANERFLPSFANRRQEYPIEEREVISVPVDPDLFFSSLPGWPLAIRLAGFDRSTHNLKTIDGAERYYRLGAGLLGAVAQLRTSVFDADPQPVDADAAVAWLRPQVRLLSTATMVSHVERLMALRAEQGTRLRRLTRSPYRLPDLTRALEARGIVLPERGAKEAAQERERWMQILRRVGAEYRASILRAGLRLVRTGLSDGEALTRLEHDAPLFASGARGLADRLIDAAR